MEDSINGWMLAGGAAMLTVLATGWSHLKGLYTQVAGRVVVRITVSGFQADAVLMYLKHAYSASRFGPRAYVGWKLFVRPKQRVQLVTMEVPAPSGRLYWRGWRPIWVSKSRESLGDMEEGLQASDYDCQTITVTFARGMMDADAFVSAAADYYNQQIRSYEDTGGRRHTIRYVHGSAGNTTSIITGKPANGASCPTSMSDIRSCLSSRPLGWDFSDFGPDPSDSSSAIERLALGESTLALVTEARRWRDTEGWHRDRGLPWRRGYLLHGPPGTGKTALARALAEDLDLPVFVYDLATLKNDELQKAWNQMLSEVPCMAMMEDIDAVFDHRKNIAVSTGPVLTFDCLLNCLDGVQRADGLMVVMTTNHLDRVDQAIGRAGGIGSRPGRIDRVILMNALDGAGRQKLARRILDQWPDWIDSVCRQGVNDTPAQFQERCGRLALQLHYGDASTPSRDEDGLVEDEPACHSPFPVS